MSLTTNLAASIYFKLEMIKTDLVNLFEQEQMITRSKNIQIKKLFYKAKLLENEFIDSLNHTMYEFKNKCIYVNVIFTLLKDINTLYRFYLQNF